MGKKAVKKSSSTQNSKKKSSSNLSTSLGSSDKRKKAKHIARSKAKTTKNGPASRKGGSKVGPNIKKGLRFEREMDFFENISKRIRDLHIGKDSMKNVGKSFNSHSPKGIKILAYYTILLFIFHLTYSLLTAGTPSAIFFGYLVKGSVAILANVMLLVFLFMMVFGFFKERRWVFPLSILWFSLGILDSILGLFMKTYVFNSINFLAYLSFITVLLVNSLVIWYLIKRKDFFLNSKTLVKNDVKDKILIGGLILVWGTFLILASVFSISFYKNTISKTDKIIDEINGKFIWEASEICSKKENEEADLCYLIIAVKQGDTYSKDIFNICQNIDSPLFKLTCEKAFD